MPEYQSRGIQYNSEWNTEENRIDHELSLDANATASVENINPEDAHHDEDVPGDLDTLVNQMPIEPRLDSKLCLATAEQNTPVSLFSNEFSEELAYPSLFAGQKRTAGKFVHVPYSRVCKAEMQSKDKRFSQHRFNRFFKIKKLQFSRMSKKAAVALRKRYTKDCIVKDIKSGDLEKFLLADKGFSFLSTQRLSPSYYKSLERNYLAWIRQLGNPTFFLTFSMPEAHWPDLLKILYKSKYPEQIVPSEDDLLNLFFSEKSKLIREDPVSIVRHFHKKLRYLLKRVLQNSNGPLGEVTDYIGSVESQFRGSAHVHLLVYVKVAPDFNRDPDKLIADFVDKCCSVSRQLPDIDGINLSEEDRNLPSKLQQHRHKQTCYKGNRSKCRFDFPHPPLRTTTIIRPFSIDTSEAEVLCARKNFLKL